MDRLLTDTGALATIVAVFLTAILTVFITILTQIWSEKRQQLQITYSKSIQSASILAQDEINKNLLISYKGKEVKELRYFNAIIVNSGKKTITDFQFNCEFDNGIQSVDNEFPKVVTKSPPNIEPDEPILDQPNNSSNIYHFTTKSLVVGQSIILNFLFSSSASDKFELNFIRPEYKIQKKVAVSTFPTLERNIQNVILNLALFYIISNFAALIPAFLGTFGGLTFLEGA